MAKAKKDEVKKEIKIEKEEVKKEDTKVEKTKKKTKSQILNALKTKEDEINIEILNIGVGNAAYLNKMGISYFDLDMGESEILSLKLVKEICSKSISFFKDYVITISNVFTDEFSIDEVLMYLGLDKVYKDIENYDIDFLKEIIVDYDVDEFEKCMKKHDKKFIKMMACKMIQLYRIGEEISREKERTICEILEIDNLNF